MRGDGAAVEPKDSMIKAPADGIVSFLFPTKHAIGFETTDGIALLIHIGIDTVKLKGEGFEVLVEEGQKVKKGEPLLKVDLSYIKEHAPSLISPVVCSELEKNDKVYLLRTGTIKAGEPLFQIERY